MKMKSNSGFSLIELMIVVGIIGILATIAVPKMQTFRSKAMKTEANLVLNNLSTLQQAYSLENSTYAVYASAYGGAGPWYGRDPNNAIAGDKCGTAADATVQAVNKSLGFSIEPCVAGKSPRYGYTVYSAAPVSAFNLVAHSGAGAKNLIFPGCNSTDTITMTQARVRGGTDLAQCP